MEKLLFVLLCCLAEAHVKHHSDDEVDWCSLTCSQGEQNTMCKYEPKVNSGKCKNIMMATDKLMRKELLHLHNEFRDKIANGEKTSNGRTWPKASNMRQLGWDYDLERLAYRWAQQCSENPFHDSCRRTPMFQYNGQNWAATPGFEYPPSANASYDLWVKEISNASPAILDNFVFGSGSAAHFTQVVWAETYKLGCSAIHTEKTDSMKWIIVICDYGPGGNVVGGKVYRKGDPCTKCPSPSSCRSDSVYPHLCALSTDDKMPAEIADPTNRIMNRSCNRRLFGTQPEESKPLMILLLTIFYSLIENKVPN